MDALVSVRRVSIQIRIRDRQEPFKIESEATYVFIDVEHQLAN
jgi:hypothetical protein